HVLRLLEALAAEDGGALLDEVERLDERAPDYAAVLDELMSTLQRLAVIQLVGERAPDEELEALKPLAQRISPEDVQLYYQSALQGKRDLPVGRDPRVGVEMTLLRMLAFRPKAEVARPAGGGDPGSAPVGPTSAPASRASASQVSAGGSSDSGRAGSTAGRAGGEPGGAAAAGNRGGGSSGAAAIRAKLAAGSGGSATRRSGAQQGSRPS